MGRGHVGGASRGGQTIVRGRRYVNGTTQRFSFEARRVTVAGFFCSRGANDMMTPAEVRKMMDEYRIPGDATAIFADTSHATVSKWTRGLLNVSDELAERIECAVSAMASMSHYYDLPIRWSEVEKLRPIVE